MTRILDIFFASLALAMFTPFLIPIILILLFTGERKVFYFQERIGKHGVTFKLVKLVTMYENSPNTGTGTITTKDDPRILPIGKYLRKSKINELTQIWNVLVGDMSLIGPRPLTNETFNYYSKDTSEYILKVRPGLSGIGSILFRSEENLLISNANPKIFYRDIIAPYKGKLEEWYVQNTNVRLYMLAIFITIWTVIFPKSKIIWKVFKSLPKPPAELECFR
ncbi:sugar transferase [Amylibacter sp.]|nr:sugar transferase [Amylibacter sp.]